MTATKGARMTAGSIEPVPEPPVRSLRETLASRKRPSTSVDFVVDDETTIPVDFQALGALQYEDLLAAHPPLEGQRTRLAWNPNTFAPAVLAASSVPAELDETFWSEYVAGATSKTVADLLDVVFTLNGITQVRRPT